jgi:hypothetical protein
MRCGLFLICKSCDVASAQPNLPNPSDTDHRLKLNSNQLSIYRTLSQLPKVLRFIRFLIRPIQFPRFFPQLIRYGEWPVCPFIADMKSLSKSTN